MDTKYSCPICNDTGWVFMKNDKGYEYAADCKCKVLKASMKRLERSGLAKEFKTKSFDNFYTDNNSMLEDAKSTAQNYTNHFNETRDNRFNSMLLCGQVGAGKTHLGTACSVELINQGIAVVYMGYREEMTALKSLVTDTDAYTKEIDKYKKAPVLFIDDFLKGKITEADINVVYEIVNYRYNNNLPIIISTEKNLDSLINFDEAIGSRIIEMCRGHIIEFRGKELNYRLYGGVA